MSKEDVVWSMAREILRLRMKLMNREVGVGNCPHKIFPLKNGRDWKCGDFACSNCHEMWFSKKKSEVAQEIMKEYGLERK